MNVNHNHQGCTSRKCPTLARTEVKDDGVGGGGGKVRGTDVQRHRFNNSTKTICANKQAYTIV